MERTAVLNSSPWIFLTKLGVDGDALLGAAKKVDPQLSQYLAEQPKAADFLRWARDKQYDKDDFERLTRMAKAARLGKEENDA
jgi:hypothetical protein